MNLRDLKYLVALAEHRHFGKAAAASFVSQPTLSTQIRKLEEELGVALVERSPRKVMLTAAGENIAARAQHIVAEVDALRDVARRSADPGAGSLRLGIFPTLAPYLLPHIIPVLQSHFPQLQLLLIEEKSAELITQLRQGKLDVALLALPVDDAQLHWRELFKEPFLLAAPVSHPLSKHEGTLPLHAVNGETLLLLQEGHCMREQALDVCQLSGAQENSAFRATSLETLRHMVAAGAGLTLLPALVTAAPLTQPQSLALIAFEQPVPHRSIALVWRKSSALTGLFEALAEHIRHAAQAQLDALPYGKV